MLQIAGQVYHKIAFLLVVTAAAILIAGPAVIMIVPNLWSQ
jgi:hypothetical protein